MTTTQKQFRVRVTYSGNSVDGTWTSDAVIHVEVGDEVGARLARGWYAEDAIEFDDDSLSDACELDGTLTEVHLIVWAIRKYGEIREVLGLPKDTDWTPYSLKDLDSCDDDDLTFLARTVRKVFGDEAGAEQAAALGF